MSGKFIQELNDPNVFMLEETDPDEIIFCQHDLPNNGVNTAKSDSSYRKPDHEQYFFSTMEQSCYAMYANNMVTPIRPKGMLRQSEKIMQGLQLNQNTNKGIYIVEYFRISKVYGGSTNDLKRLLDYYYNTMNIYPNKIHIKNNIAKRFEITKRANMLAKPVTLKVITFIKQEDIQQYRQVYIPTLGVIIGAGTLDDSICNTANRDFTQAVNNSLKSDVANFIEVNIVDNDEGYYYMKVGNSVLRFESYKDTRKTEGASVISYTGHMITRQDFYHKADMKKVGFYRSQEEAIKGPVDLEQLKLEYEYKKLVENNKFDKVKRETDVALLKERIRQELLIQEQKTQQEYLKTIDAGIKHKANIKQLEREAYLMEKKIELEEEKGENAAANNAFAMASKLLGFK